MVGGRVVAPKVKEEKCPRDGQDSNETELPLKFPKYEITTREHDMIEYSQDNDHDQ